MGFSRQKYLSGVPLPSPLLTYASLKSHYETEGFNQEWAKEKEKWLPKERSQEVIDYTRKELNTVFFKDILEE